MEEEEKEKEEGALTSDIGAVEGFGRVGYCLGLVGGGGLVFGVCLSGGAVECLCGWLMVCF